MQPHDAEELERRLALATDRLVAEVMDATARAERAEHDASIRSGPPMQPSMRSRIAARIGRAGGARTAETGDATSESPPQHPSPTATRSLLAFPYYPGNRWQDIMYGDAVARRHWVMKPLEVLDHAALADFGAGDVLHVNWTAQVTQGTPDLVRSASNARRAIGAVGEFQDRGGRVVWTIHNVLPHELHHLGPELALCRELAARADAVTVMNPSTAALVGDWYPLPSDRTIRIPHPSYRGEFRDDVSREEARRRLGIEPDEIALLFVGQLRPYKGLRELSRAFDELHREDRRFRLLVAGEPGPGFTDADRRALEAAEPGRTVRIGRVPDDEMQVWCRSADLMVLPYRAALNVSLVSVAATFGLPVALKDAGGQGYLAAEEWISLLPADHRGFAAGIRVAALRTAEDRTRLQAQAGRFADETAPAVIGRRFTELIEGLVAGR